MSSDDTSLLSNSDSQTMTGQSGVSEDAVALKSPKTMPSDESLKQEKFKQDQLKMDKFREEMLRQEKLRQELEDQELERQQGQKQEQLKQQQQLEQEQLKKQQKVKQIQLKLAEQQRVAEEQKLLEQVKIESERAAQEKIIEEQARQEKLMRERLEKEQIERDQQQLNIPAAQAFEPQPVIIDSTPEEPVKSSIFGLADKLRSTLKSVEESVAIVKAPEQAEEVVAPPVIEIPRESVEKSLVKVKVNARSLQLCGNIEDQIYTDNLDNVRYEPEDFVLSSILYYLDESKHSSAVIRLKFDDIVIVVDYALNTIYCNEPLLSPKFDKFCSQLSTSSAEVYQLKFEEVRAERRNSFTVGNSVETFIWTSTLLTAKGRLPLYADSTRSIGVKQDADLSKLEAIPYLDELVAELKETPCKLMEIATRLNIPQKYVISFYHAASNLDLLEFDMTKKEIKPKKASSGFFSFKK